MERDELEAAAEDLNTGAEIPTIAASLIEAAWKSVSRIPKDQRQRVAIGIGAFAMVDPADAPQTAEQKVALMARLGLLDGLIEQGILDECMDDDSKRKHVFAAAASFPCNKNDLGEVMAQKQLRESPPDVAEKIREDLRQSGYDPDDSSVGKKFREWMRDNC